MSNKIKGSATESSDGVKYVVIRNGARVSDSEYPTKEDAKNEYEHWNRIITRWPDGSKLDIVEMKGK
jgi:hypothetical protein